MSEDINEQKIRREERRKKRIRMQVFSYVVVIILILLLAFGIVMGVQYLTKHPLAAGKDQDVQQSKVEDLLKTEEDITAPELQETEEPIVELTKEQKLDAIVNAAIEVMPIEDKVAGLFIVTPESITGVSAVVKAGDGTKDALAEYAVGGLIYEKKNIVDSEQLKSMIENTKIFSRYPVFLAINEEGGSYSTMAASGLVEPVDSPETMGNVGDMNAVYATGTQIADYMKEYGFNLNFGPVADVATVDNSVMRKRVFGSKANVIAPFVNAISNALEVKEITACVKYFPGMGSVTQDTSKEMAISAKTQEEFEQEEFAIYKEIIENGTNMIMVANMAAPALTGDNTPCSLSESVVTQVLREKLDYDGVIITGALSDKAISEYYASDEAAIMALKAGCDMILTPEDFEKAYTGVLQAVKDGTISEERINDALRRVYRIKFADKISEE